MRSHSIGFKLVTLSTILVVLISLFLGSFSIYNSQRLLLKNANLTSIQTLEESKKALNIYFKSLSQSVNLLTRKDELINLGRGQHYPKNIDLVANSITAALGVTDGAIKGYYATNDGITVEVSTSTQDDNITYSTHVTEGEVPVTKDWFAKALTSTNRNEVSAYYSSPYVDVAKQTSIITVSQCVKSNGVTLGVVALDINFNAVTDFVQNIKLLNTGYTELVGPDGSIYVASLERAKIIEGDFSDTPMWLDFETTQSGSKSYKINGMTYYLTCTTDNITGWKLFGYLPSTEITSSFTSFRSLIFVAMILSVGLGLVATIITVKPIIKKIMNLKDFVSKLAKGDFSSKISISGKDEIAILSTELNQMTENVSSLLKDIHEASNSLVTTSTDIIEIEKQTRETSTNTNLAMQEIARGNNSLAENTQQVNLQIDNLSHQLDDSDHYIREARTMSKETHLLSKQGMETLHCLSAHAEKTTANVQLSNKVFNEMTSSIEKIHYISDTIAQITSQTNLLSLNASIEAARAGESGKGFVVVATEIRKLADASKASTDEIRSIIDEINQKSLEASHAISEVQDILLEENKAVHDTLTSFEQIIASLNGLTDHIHEISKLNKTMMHAKNTVVSNTEEIAAISEETASSSEEISASTTEAETAIYKLGQHIEDLNTLAHHLKTGISQFTL